MNAHAPGSSSHTRKCSCQSWGTAGSHEHISTVMYGMPMQCALRPISPTYLHTFMKPYVHHSIHNMAAKSAAKTMFWVLYLIMASPQMTVFTKLHVPGALVGCMPCHAEPARPGHVIRARWVQMFMCCMLCMQERPWEVQHGH